MEIWELTVRERIRDTLARYQWAGDSLRLEELALAFCEDGVLEVKGEAPYEGRAAIVDFLSGVGRRGDDAPAPPPGVKRLVRHNLTNLRFLEVEPTRALIASYFTVVTEIGLDHVGRYRDTLVPVGDEWLFQHRFVSTDWATPGSPMVR